LIRLQSCNVGPFDLAPQGQQALRGGFTTGSFYRIFLMRFRLLVLSGIVFAVGCGAKAVSVSGKVTYGGEPIANAGVTFVPIGENKDAGAGSEGKTDANGNYSLNMISKKTPGAPPGKYKVLITWSGATGEIPEAKASPKPREEKLPAKYNTKSELTFDVPPGGTSSADFKLEKGPPPGEAGGSAIPQMPK
jgi:hypothetical protein